MKLIVDIQDFVYNNVKEFDTTHNYELNIVESIKNGIPLEDIERQIAEKSFTGNDGLDYVEMLVVCKTLKGE